MLRKDVRDLIDWHLAEYGQGYGYEIYLNGRRIWRSGDLKKEAQEGDRVMVEVYRGHGKYAGGYVIDNIEFVIENDQDAIARQRRYRESRREMRQKYKRPNDYQRQRLYSWERKAVVGFRDKITWEESVEFVNDMFERLGLPAPKMKFHRGRTRRCAYYPSFHEIRMGPWGLTKPILVHEAAHAVVKLAGLNSQLASHGPAFVRAYIDLMGRFLLTQHPDKLTQNAKAFGLDVADDFDFQKLAKLVKEGKDVPADVVESLRKPTKNDQKLNEKQLAALKAIKVGREVDGRSARALVNRGYAAKTLKGGYLISPEGEKMLNETK